MKLELIKAPSDWLTKKMEPIDVNNPPYDLKELKTEMFRIMRANLGIGLSANQVGIDGRVFVFYNNNTNNHLERDMMCINPEIIEDKGEPVSMFEGCLSFPGVTIPVIRTNKIRARWTTINGKVVEEDFFGYDARCILHEIDHLDGITFDQHVSPMVWKEAVDKAKKETDA
tara:strand:+ start:1521 stop:2033 length:513 start_codon:yes stop_codon:yes gene_type:complete